MTSTIALQSRSRPLPLPYRASGVAARLGQAVDQPGDDVSTMVMIGIVFVACLRRGASAVRYTPLSTLATDRTCCRRSGGNHQVVAEDDHWPCE